MIEKKEKQEQKEEKITFHISKENNFSEWFSQIIERAELADIRYNVKGLIVFMPWSVLAMEKMYDAFEQELQKQGHMPCYFPALIPKENFEKEATHVKGFAPDVFWVTEYGDAQKLEEKYALRPTSETAFYQLYSLWIRSWKDLPLKLYQRAQVWRHETKATRPFIRSREFYWIEAHDVFSTRQEAEEQVKKDMQTTEKIMHQHFGIPFIYFQRPEWDKFAGAIYTYGADSLMPDGRVIQQPSTHLLGQGFAKVFDVKFKDKNSKEQYAWQTCYGPAISRIFASVIAMHGDDSGLIFPFCLAPIQVVIIPILEKGKKDVEKRCMEIEKNLLENGIKVKIDMTEKRPGEKYYFWEMKGVPLRIEIGKKELESKQLTLFLRDAKQRKKISENAIIKEIEKEGIAFDERLKKKADEWFSKKIEDASNMEEIKKILDEKKIARCNFCSISKEGEKCAEIVEKQFLASVRGIRVDKEEKSKGKCIFCKKQAKNVVYIARGY